LGLDLIDPNTRRSGYPTGTPSMANALNVSLLGAVDVQLGEDPLPLISDPNGGGLLHLGEAGVPKSYAESSSVTSSTASAGAVEEDGSIALDPNNPGAYGPARVNLTDLLDQLEVSGLTDQIVDEVSLELGAVASRAEATGGQDPKFSSDYVLADGKLVISSPAVAGLSSGLGQTIDGVGATLNTAVGTEGVLGTVANNVAIDTNLGIVSVKAGGGTVGIDGLDTALEGAKTALLETTLVDENELVSIDLATGAITVDLKKL